MDFEEWANKAIREPLEHHANAGTEYVEGQKQALLVIAKSAWEHAQLEWLPIGAAPAQQTSLVALGAGDFDFNILVCSQGRSKSTSQAAVLQYKDKLYLVRKDDWNCTYQRYDANPLKMSGYTHYMPLPKPVLPPSP